MPWWLPNGSSFRSASVGAILTGEGDTRRLPVSIRHNREEICGKCWSFISKLTKFSLSEREGWDVCWLQGKRIHPWISSLPFLFIFFQGSSIIDDSAYLAKEFSEHKIHFNSNFCLLNKLLFFPSYIWSQNHRTTKQISLISLWTFLLTSFYFSKRINVSLHDCSFPDRRGRELFLKLLKSEALALYKSIPTGYQDCVWKHMW